MSIAELNKILDEFLKRVDDECSDNNVIDGVSTGTTSRLFKRHLIRAFGELNLESVLEMSGKLGVTTHILSHLFKRVIYIEKPDLFDRHSTIAKRLNRDRENIEYIPFDAYGAPWDFPPQDCVFIDCRHTFDCAFSDIRNALSILKPHGYIVLHDYNINTVRFGDDGGERKFCCGIKKAVSRAVNRGMVAIVRLIGTYKHSLQEYEGVICTGIHTPLGIIK